MAQTRRILGPRAALPDAVRILGIKFQIKYLKEKIEDPEGKFDNVMAQVEKEGGPIKVYIGKTGERLREQVLKSLWHEILHMIIWEMRLFAIMPTEIKDSDLEEYLVTMLATALPTVEFIYL